MQVLKYGALSANTITEEPIDMVLHESYPNRCVRRRSAGWRLRLGAWLAPRFAAGVQPGPSNQTTLSPPLLTTLLLHCNPRSCPSGTRCGTSCS